MENSFAINVKNLLVKLLIGKKCLWILTSRGFASEYNNLLYAINYCKYTKKKIFLYPDKSCYCKFLDYYLPNREFTNEKEYKFTFIRYIIKQYPVILWFFRSKKTCCLFIYFILFILFYLFYLFILFILSRSMSLISSGYKNDLIFYVFFYSIRKFNRKQKTKNKNDFISDINRILKNIWKFNTETKEEIAELLLSPKINFFLKKEYFSIHIRRGDKITLKEAKITRIEQYIATLKDIPDIDKNIKNIFIMTDDYECFIEIKNKYKEYNFYTLASKKAKGHKQSDFNNNHTRQDIIQLLTEIEITRKAKVFVGTKSSNIFRLIEYFKDVKCFNAETEDDPFQI